MKTLALTLAAALSLGAAQAHAEDINRVYTGTFPIAQSVKVPAGYDTVYVSGLLADPIDAKAGLYGDTEAQTKSVLTKIQAALAAQGFGMKDVVMMRVLLVGDPKLGGKMDFAGLMKSYVLFFGTPEQPNKPSRIASQVAALAAPWALVEIEVQAAKKP